MLLSHEQTYIIMSSDELVSEGLHPPMSMVLVKRELLKMEKNEAKRLAPHKM